MCSGLNESDSMPLLARVAVLIPSVLALLGTLFLADLSDPSTFTIALVLLTMSILSVGACWPLRGLQPAAPLEVWGIPPLSNVHRTIAGIGIGALLLVAETSGRLIGLWAFLSRSGHFQFALLCLGLAALGWGLSGGFALRLDQLHINAGWIFLAALTLLALLIRIINLATTIPAFVDEINFIAPIWVFRDTSDAQLLYPINNVAAFPRLYVYLEMLTSTVFGRDLSGLRLVSAIFGTLTVPAVYLLARELFPQDRHTPWIAAAIIAVLPIHVHFSRLALNNIADPLFGTLTFALVARGVRTGARSSFVLAGIALGLTQYFHEAGRLSLPVLMALWLGVMLVGQWRSVPRRPFLLFMFTAAITALPVYYTLLAARYPIAARTAGVGLSPDYWTSQQNLLQPFIDAASRFDAVMARLLRQPEIVHYYAGETPYLPFYITPLLILGFGTALWRAARPGAFLLVIWALLPLIAIAVLLAEVQSPRIVVILPALAVLTALGLKHAVTGLVPEKMHTALLAGTTTLLCSICVIYYFSFHAPAFTRQHFNAQPWQQIVYAAQDLPAYTVVHVIYDRPLPDHDVNIAINFMRTGITVQVHKPETITPDLLRNLPPGVNHAFFVKMTIPVLAATDPNSELPDTAEDVIALIEETLPQVFGPYPVAAPHMGKHWFAYYLLPGDTTALP